MQDNGFVIALGMFDGVHRGHQALLQRTAALARKLGGRPMAFCFLNHPAEIFGREVRYLSTAEQRRDWMLALGMERVEMIPFTRDFAGLSPEAFLAYLQERFPVKGLVAGFNYTFGRAGAGTGDTLRQLGQAVGIAVDILEPVLLDGSPVSSSRIREALLAGRLEEAEQMLTRPYTLRGAVVANRHIGRTIGFPTANMEYGRYLLPPDGVYAARARAGEENYAAVTNIGCNPTVEGKKRTVETHLLGERVELYGRVLEVELLSRIREERTFSSLEALKEQIARDAAQAAAKQKSF